ncbi:MAG TPA: hypothetical protein VE224_06330 [Pseudolabrys sp.]|nr:hypothetical protein [Pseudolabrys sp.]
MMRPAASFSRYAAVLGCAATLLCAGAALQPAAASSGPFSNFHGDWAGGGILRIKGDDNKLSTERVRCNASYRQSSGNEVNLKLTCRSDTYNFDLTGDFQSDPAGNITGDWSEETRHVGGSVTGRARGDRLLVHAESPALNANLSMYTRSRTQSVNLKAAGAGQQVTASISLRRR